MISISCILRLVLLARLVHGLREYDFIVTIHPPKTMEVCSGSLLSASWTLVGSMSKRCLQGERPTSLSVLSEIVMKAHNQTRKIADIKIPDGYREQEFFPDLCLLKADREWDLETGFLRPISINRGSLVPKCLVHSQTFSNTNNGELLVEEVTPYPHEYCSLRFGVVVAYGQMCALVAPKNLTKTQVGLSQEGIGQSTVGQYADDKGTERYENEGSLSRPDKAGDQVAVEEKTTEAEPQEQNNGSTQTIGNVRKSRGIFQGQEYFKVRSISSEWDVSTGSQQNRGASEIYDVRDEGRKASQTRQRKYLVGKRKLLRKLQGHQPGKQKDLREAEVQIEKQEREEVETEKQVQEETQTEKQVKEDVQTEKQVQGDVQSEKQVQDDVQSEKQVQEDVQSEKQVQEDVQTEKKVQDDMQSEKQIQEKREEQAERPKESQDEERTGIQEEESQRGVEEGGLSGRYPEPTTSAEEEDGQNVTDRLEPGSPLLCGDSLTALKDLTVFYSSNLTGLIRVDIYARLTQFIPWIVDNVHDLEPMVRLDSGYEDELFKAPGPYPIVRQTGIVVDKSAGMSEGPSAKLTTSAIALISLIYYVVRQ